MPTILTGKAKREYIRKQVAAWRANQRKRLGLPPAMSRAESAKLALAARRAKAKESEKRAA